MTKELTLAEQIAAAKAMKNQSVAKTGGDYEREIAPEGNCYGRFLEYIELGKFPAEFEGKPKPPAARVRLMFELLTAVPKKGPDGKPMRDENGKLVMVPNVKEVEVEGGKRKFANQISIELTESQSDKSGFYKLFKAMQYGREEITHFAEMLGDAYKLEVVHNTTNKGKQNEATYANVFTKERGWLVSSPFMESTDPDTLEITRTDMSSKVPAAISPIRLFLFDLPTQGSWDSLFIDGTRTVKGKDGAPDTEESKNWLQEKIMSAVNYGGSALEQMLGGVADLPGMEDTSAKANAETETKAVTQTAASIPSESAPADTQTPATVTKDEDAATAALREMGLLD